MSDFVERMMEGLSKRVNLGKAATLRDVYEAVYSSVEVVVDLIKEHKVQIDELEKNGARFRGVYQRAASYRRGDQVTHKGSLWVALKEAPEGIQPGESPDHWQLAAKGAG